MPDIRIGAAYSFIPKAFIGEKAETLMGKKEIPAKVTGRIVYINESHRFFTVAYDVNGYTLRESIKF